MPVKILNPTEFQGNFPIFDAGNITFTLGKMDVPQIVKQNTTSNGGDEPRLYHSITLVEENQPFLFYYNQKTSTYDNDRASIEINGTTTNVTQHGALKAKYFGVGDPHLDITLYRDDASHSSSNSIGSNWLSDIITNYEIVDYSTSGITMTVRYGENDLSNPETDFDSWGTEYDSTQYDNIDNIDGNYNDYGGSEGSGDLYTIAKIEDFTPSYKYLWPHLKVYTYADSKNIAPGQKIYLWNFNTESWDKNSGYESYDTGKDMPQAWAGDLQGSRTGGDPVEKDDYLGTNGEIYFKIFHKNSTNIDNPTYVRVGYIGMMSLNKLKNIDY